MERANDETVPEMIPIVFSHWHAMEVTMTVESERAPPDLEESMIRNVLSEVRYAISGNANAVIGEKVKLMGPRTITSPYA